MRILLAGGGSGGPVSPVLAVAMELRKLDPKIKFLFVGTRKGPERLLVEGVKIPFVTIPAAKWRRYFSIKNFFSPLIFILGFFKSLYIVSKFRPDLIFSAGGFVAVPVSWAARLFGAKVIIHQQDARIGLANKLIAPVSNLITAAFEGTAKEFYSQSGLFPGGLKPGAEWVGNPVRADLVNFKHDASKKFNLNNTMPVLLVLTGATGAKQINDYVKELLPKLTSMFQVVHQTGKGKNTIQTSDPNYHAFELIGFEDYAWILKKAHLVVARAGLSTITELSALGKTAVIIPMPNTHQEDNGKILRLTDSAVVLSGPGLNADSLFQVLNKLNYDANLSGHFAQNIQRLMPTNAASKIAKLILKNVESQ